MSDREGFIKDLRDAEDSDSHSRRGAFVRRILAPTDLTSDSKNAVDYAIAFARATGARVTLHHVHESSLGPDYVFGRNDYGEEDGYRADAEKALRQLRAEYKGQHVLIDTSYSVGVLWEEVAHVAIELEADIIIVSTHSYNWVNHLFEGSDAERMVRRASCPVLVVPEGF
jgi:nucleotide-binding universal stress UspA family protein